MQLEWRLSRRFAEHAAAAILANGGGERNLVYYSAVLLLEAPLAVEAVPKTLYACYTAVFSAKWPGLAPQLRREAIRLMQVGGRVGGRGGRGGATSCASRKQRRSSTQLLLQPAAVPCPLPRLCPTARGVMCVSPMQHAPARRC